MTRIRADELVTVAEAAELVGRTETEFRALAKGPLSPDGDRISLRRALGAVLLTQFSETETLTVDDAVAVAATAAESVTDGGMNTMVVGWDQRGPFMRWADTKSSTAALDTVLHAPVMLIPANQMLIDLGETVVALRNRSRPQAHQLWPVNSVVA